MKANPKEYDFALSWPDNKRTPFIKWVREGCADKALTFLQIHDGNISETIERLEERKIRIHFLLDMNATYNSPGDLYARLCYTVKDTGGKVIDDPDHARFSIDKSISHYCFVRNNIPVPYTLIIRSWQLDKIKVPDDIKKELGVPFIIKPAMGFGGKGVITDAKWKLKNITMARNFDRTDNYLLQEKINPIIIEDKPAWFRTYYVFGKIIPCWWNPSNGEYSHVNKKEFSAYNLSKLKEVPPLISQVTGMDWFSTEIAYCKKKGRISAVVVDYINDQCHLDVKSMFPSAPPNHVVKCIAENMVKAADLHSKGLAHRRKNDLWLNPNVLPKKK